jgi:hypothetical protein
MEIIGCKLGEGIWAKVAQLVWQLATGWMAWESNSGGGEIFPSILTGPGAQPASYTIDTGSFTR